MKSTTPSSPQSLHCHRHRPWGSTVFFLVFCTPCFLHKSSHCRYAAGYPGPEGFRALLQVCCQVRTTVVVRVTSTLPHLVVGVNALAHTCMGCFQGKKGMSFGLPYRDKARNDTAPHRRGAFRDINSTVSAIAIKHQGVVEASRCKFLDLFSRSPPSPGLGVTVQSQHCCINRIRKYKNPPIPPLITRRVKRKRGVAAVATRGQRYTQKRNLLWTAIKAVVPRIPKRHSPKTLET